MFPVNWAGALHGLHSPIAATGFCCLYMGEATGKSIPQDLAAVVFVCSYPCCTGDAIILQAVYVPADDMTDPAPATTFIHLDATTVLARSSFVN